jgi:hypothetical protein
MWSDDLDKKLQEASGEHTPPFDEKAWGKMEVLLDKHLPQKKKRRGLIFLLAFLAVGGTAAFFTLQNSKSRSSSEAVKEITKQTPVNTSPAKSGAGDLPAQPTTTKETAGNEPAGQTRTPQIKDNTITSPTAPAPEITLSSPETNTILPLPGSKTGKTNKNIATRAMAQDVVVAQGNTAYKTGRKKDIKKKSYYPSKAGQQGEETADVTKPETAAPQTSTTANPAVTTPSTTASAKPVDSARKETAPEVAATKPDAAAKKNPGGESRGSKFSLQFSFGPDISSVGSGNMGRLKLQAGLGAAYALSKKFTVRTGFYVSRKIYSADSNQYHPPKGFWNYYPNLDKVDANCLVYEIPVSVAYNFATGKRSNWFASAGLSSYIMKKENYGFSYKDVWGANQYHSIDLNNENKHFFSVVDLSAGYQYNLTERLSLAAEPYVRIPVSGVGFGKVKLNSGGVLFTVGFKPFKK